MNFETKQDVLDWYEGQERALTPSFIKDIPWHDVKNHRLPDDLVPVLIYMRDIEILTDMYHEELRRTPTGKDRVISKFMERWGIEEITHGELINRFLNEAGYNTPVTWKEDVKSSVTSKYHLYARLLTTLTNCVGKSFTATHMAYGAINELSAAQSYRRLIAKAEHPVLTHFVKGIIREESVHTQFYLSVARLELRKSRFARRIARFVIDNFWNPVGSGARPKDLSDYTIAKLFHGKEGHDWFERLVTEKIRPLPGFDGLTSVTERIAVIADESPLSAPRLLIN
ncbi:MAG: ferritin-like domain-containing protein [Acidobacteriota bacterium]|nr:ferritin-like domain-containing protein [Acidobacteriota bacterium]MDH3529908.1 ferritin-like domain-containing protein [Acidobacteriota bacterium]